MEITKEQEERILALDPNFFKVELEVGKWYKHTTCNNTICFKIDNSGYGIWEGKWSELIIIVENDNWTPATHQEVEDALIIEAKKRGFKKGVTVSRTQKMLDEHEVSLAEKVVLIVGNEYVYDGYLSIDGRVIFIGGKWAEILETITKAEAEKLLNKIII